MEAGPVAWRSGTVARPALHRPQVVVPEVDVHAVAGRRLGPPQLPGGEAHAVAVLWLLVAGHGVGVGEDEDAVIASDHPTLAAGIAGQAGVTEGMLVVGQDLIADLELRRHLVVQ